jgi:hypothetical protein
MVATLGLGSKDGGYFRLGFEDGDYLGLGLKMAAI